MLFLARAEELFSDGAVIDETGTVHVSSTVGATLTSANGISALQAANKRRMERATCQEAAIPERERHKTTAALR